MKLCEDCGHHAAMRDAAKCWDCMNAYLRATRPVFVPEWLRRGREGLNRTKDLTGASR